MRIYLLGLIFAFTASPAISEPMPWETEEYFESRRQAQQDHLSKFPLEMMLFIVAPSKPDEPPFGWIRLGELIEFPLDPRLKISSTFKVSPGMKIGQNEGVIKEITSQGIVIEEKLPVCGESGSTSRTTLLKLNEPLPAGTTVKYAVIDGKNECE